MAQYFKDEKDRLTTVAEDLYRPLWCARMLLAQIGDDYRPKTRNRFGGE